MSPAEVVRIPLVDADDARCAELVRKVVFPSPDPTRDDEFFPAVAGIKIGSSSEVDVSYLYSFNHHPSAGCERHLLTEEMFIPLEGELCMPVAPCPHPDTEADRPAANDFVGIRVCHGEALILRPNVWHYGGWPFDAKRGVRYLMVLSGHRQTEASGGRLDHLVTTILDEVEIYPDW